MKVLVLLVICISNVVDGSWSVKSDSYELNDQLPTDNAEVSSRPSVQPVLVPTAAPTVPVATFSMCNEGCTTSYNTLTVSEGECFEFTPCFSNGCGGSPYTAIISCDCWGNSNSPWSVTYYDGYSSCTSSVWGTWTGTGLECASQTPIDGNQFLLVVNCAGTAITSSSDKCDSGSSSAASAGTVAGAVVGSLVGIGILSALCYYYFVHMTAAATVATATSVTATTSTATASEMVASSTTANPINSTNENTVV